MYLNQIKSLEMYKMQFEKKAKEAQIQVAQLRLENQDLIEKMCVI